MMIGKSDYKSFKKARFHRPRLKPKLKVHAALGAVMVETRSLARPALRRVQAPAGGASTKAKVAPVLMSRVGKRCKEPA